MMIRIVELPKFVIKVIAWMHVDKKDAGIMQNANIQCMMQGVIASQATQEIQTTNAFHVSVNRFFKYNI